VALTDAVSNPVKAHIHSFRLALSDCVIGYASGAGRGPGDVRVQLG
jgi:hypothetical protein